MALGAVIGIGWRAAELLRARPEVRVVAPTRASIYIGVGGEILWLGGPTELMHSRAVLLSETPDPTGYVEGDAVSLPCWLMPPWRPAAPDGDAAAASRLRHNARKLADLAMSVGEPRGFGGWLVGNPMAFPLASAESLADALSRACARDDARAATEAARALLGLGAGLTPSGDDFVGGAFFARAVITPVGTPSWAEAATAVRAAASVATNPISAALLGDLLGGHGWSALHDLAAALAADDTKRALDATRRLTRLGHSSGWDVLAGFVAGAG